MKLKHCAPVSSPQASEEHQAIQKPGQSKQCQTSKQSKFQKSKHVATINTPHPRKVQTSSRSWPVKPCSRRPSSHKAQANCSWSLPGPWPTRSKWSSLKAKDIWGQSKASGVKLKASDVPGLLTHRPTPLQKVSSARSSNSLLQQKDKDSQKLQPVWAAGTSQGEWPPLRAGEETPNS